MKNKKMFLYIFATITGIALIGGLLIYQHCFSLHAKLDRYLTNLEQQGKLSASVLVAQKGKNLLCKGYGKANYEHMVSNTPKTKFDIGSITKQFTAMAIIQLVQAEKLKTSDTVASIFPDYPRGNEITIYHLLTNTSGLPHDWEAANTGSGSPTNLVAVIDRFKNTPLAFKPGDKYQYSNCGFTLLAAIIEKVSGQSFENYLHDHIFAPIGMNDSGMLHNATIITNRAQGYHVADAGLFNAPCYEPGTYIGAGELYSTILDMYRWDRSLYTDQLLTKNFRMQLWKPNLENYGMGWVISQFHDHACVWHNGGSHDCHNMFMRFPDDDVCIIILGNFDLDSTPYIENIGIQLAGIVFGKRSPKKDIIVPDPAAYDELLGQYKTNDGQIVTTIKDGDRFYVQRSGEGAHRMMSLSPTRFVEEYQPVEISFIKDAQGNIEKLVLQLNEEKIEAQKINNNGRTVILLSPEKLQECVGAYTFDKKELVMSIKIYHGALFCQLPGQPAFQLYPTSATEFFMRDVDAQISFYKDTNGRITKLILHQNGAYQETVKVV